LEPPGHEEERKTKEDLEEFSYGRGTEKRKDVEGGQEVGSRQKSLENFVKALCSYTGDNSK
jgi:hypothetical protein